MAIRTREEKVSNTHCHLVQKRTPFTSYVAILMLAIPTLVKTAGPDVIVTTADPGMVSTDVGRDFTGVTALAVRSVSLIVEALICRFLSWSLARTPEQGARPIVWAALSPIQSGEYVADCRVTL